MTRIFRLAALVLLAAACGRNEESATPAQGQGEQAAPPPAAPAPPELTLEVDVAARELHLYRNGQMVKTYGVAVGRPEWPTQNGEWTVRQVIWNPGWTPPPDESWTEDETPKDPGDPDNPLGRVQLAYDPPRTIHGTNQPQSIGQAASHGSIRMRNEDAIELARTVMEAGGAQREASFFTDVAEHRTRRVEVEIPNPVPIRVIHGAADADAVEGERSDREESEPARTKRDSAASRDSANG